MLYWLGALLVGYALFCTLFYSSYIYQKIPQWTLSAQRQAGPQVPSQTTAVSEILYERQYPGQAGKCIYPLFVPGRADCGGKIKLRDRDWARDLRCAIATCKPDDRSLRNLLHDYGMHCLCFQHRKLLKDSRWSFWNTQLDRWVRDIGRAYDLDIEAEIQVFKESADQDIFDATMSKLRAFLPRIYTPSLPGSLESLPIFSTEFAGVDEACASAKCVLKKITERHQARFKEGGPDSCEDFTEFDGCVCSMPEIIQLPLDKSEQIPGYIYIYRSAAEVGTNGPYYLKIGYTKNRVDGRSRQWTRQCDSNIELIWQTNKRHVCAKRIEKLIHNELALIGARRKDHRCQNGKGKCKAVHHEWFQVDVAWAIDVAENWTSWMDRHQPYDSASGRLRPEKVIEFSVSSSDDDTVSKGHCTTNQALRQAPLADPQTTDQPVNSVDGDEQNLNPVLSVSPRRRLVSGSRHDPIEVLDTDEERISACKSRA